MSLLKRIEELEKELEKTKGELKKGEVVERFRADSNKKFYYCTNIGTVVHCCEYGPSATKLYNAGNYFETKKQAQHFAKKRAARNRLECLALALNGEIVEFSLDREAYSIERDRNELVPSKYDGLYTNEVLFKTRELAEKVLNLTSKDDLITLFGIDFYRS